MLAFILRCPRRWLVTTNMCERLISGTRIGKILGVSPYGNARDIFEEIVNGISDPPNIYTERGNAMEPIIRSLYCARSGAVPQPKLTIVAHPDWHWATCSPDDIVSIDGRLVVPDYKSASIWTKRNYGQEMTDQVPMHYLTQVAWNTWVCGAQAGELFVAFGEDDKDESGQPTFQIKFTRRYVIERDKDLENMMFEAAKQFWDNHIVPKVAPDMEPMPRKKRKKAA